MPLDPSFFSLHGIGKLLETIDLLARETGHQVAARVLVTLYSGRSQFVKAVLEEIHGHLPDRHFRTTIRYSIKLAEAASHGLPVIDYCRHCAGFDDYAALEDGLRVLDRDLACYPCGEIDLLAMDPANQLVIVDFENTSDNGLLVRGLGHFDWIVRNASALRRMYPGLAINFSAPPRLFLLAPQFSAAAACVARQIARPQIAWVRYHVVEVGGATGILFERVAGV